jgi:hypothetical protein
MSAISLLLGLLVLSYVGSILVGGRTIRGFGLPSGSEYLVFGFVIGPPVLGVVNRTLIDTFAPLMVAGAAWLALVAGVGYCYVGRRPVHVGRALAGIGLAAFVGAGVFAAIFIGLGFGSSIRGLDRILLAGGVAATLSETTRHAVRWVVERHGARGPLSDAFADHARASVFVPAIALAVIFAAAPGQGLASVPLLARVAITVGLGVVLGLVASLLLGREFRRDESWGILLGASLLGMGVAERLNQSAVATMFFMGLTVALVSPHRADLKTMVTPTEKPVMLPVAVLAGASVQLGAAPLLPLLIAVGVGARLIMDFMRGTLHALFRPAARAGGPFVGLSMTSTGAFSLAGGVALGLRLPTPLGPSVLAFTVGSLVIGELLGPLILRRVLVRASEIIPGEAQTPPPPSVDPSRGHLSEHR